MLGCLVIVISEGKFMAEKLEIVFDLHFLNKVCECSVLNFFEKYLQEKIIKHTSPANTRPLSISLHHSKYIRRKV